MANAAQWRETIDLIRQSSNKRDRHAQEMRLYDLALHDGRSFLRSFRFDETRIEDLIQDVFSSAYEQICAASLPRAFFRRCLVHRAISWKRQKKSVDTAELKPLGLEDHSPRSGETLDAKRLLEKLRQSLSARNFQILLAVLHGENRETVAQAFGTTRDNVDQILQRVRNDLREDS